MSMTTADYLAIAEAQADASRKRKRLERWTPSSPQEQWRLRADAHTAYRALSDAYHRAASLHPDRAWRTRYGNLSAAWYRRAEGLYDRGYVQDIGTFRTARA